MAVQAGMLDVEVMEVMEVMEASLRYFILLGLTLAISSPIILKAKAEKLENQVLQERAVERALQDLH
jgi:hypothetical protein